IGRGRCDEVCGEQEAKRDQWEEGRFGLIHLIPRWLLEPVAAVRKRTAPQLQDGCQVTSSGSYTATDGRAERASALHLMMARRFRQPRESVTGERGRFRQAVGI